MYPRQYLNVTIESVVSVAAYACVQETSEMILPRVLVIWLLLAKLLFS